MRGLDYGVLLLLSGCVSNDKRDEEEDEEPDIPRVHYIWKLLKYIDINWGFVLLYIARNGPMEISLENYLNLLFNLKIKLDRRNFDIRF